jgi:O-antigen/teichoic acid export membrane protein
MGGTIGHIISGHSLRWNFAGNLVGRLWLGLMSLCTVPVYVNIIGTNAFGVVSLLGSLQALLALMDFGLAGTANRELATLRTSKSTGEIADTIRTFEIIYWVVAIVIAFGVAAFSHWLAFNWLPRQALPPETLEFAIILGGLTLAARWPIALYTGILNGLERQVVVSGIVILTSSGRAAITVMALIFISPTASTFIIAQGIANAIELSIYAYIAHRLAKGGVRGRFDVAVVRKVWRFAVGLNLTGTSGMLISGAPQLIISKILPLVELTYYSVASTATGALQVLSIATQATLFPRLASCWHKRDLIKTQELYVGGVRFTVFACVAPAMALCFFPTEVLMLWTHSTEISTRARESLQILAIATLANTASATAYTVALATGQTRLPILVNAASIPLVIAACVTAISKFGIPGAAACWFAYNLACLVIYSRYCETTLFPKKDGRWLSAIPFEFILISIIVNALSRIMIPEGLRASLQAIWLTLTVLLNYSLALLVINKNEKQLLLESLKNLVTKKRVQVSQKPIPTH